MKIDRQGDNIYHLLHEAFVGSLLFKSVHVNLFEITYFQFLPAALTLSSLHCSRFYSSSYILCILLLPFLIGLFYFLYQ